MEKRVRRGGRLADLMQTLTQGNAGGRYACHTYGSVASALTRSNLQSDVYIGTVTCGWARQLPLIDALK